MAPRTMSAAEWMNVFPRWPKPRQPGMTASDIGSTKYTDVFTVVMTRERWEQEPQLSEETDAEIKRTVGRWILTDFAIECPSYSYQIIYDRLDEPDWFYHLLEKTWFYDPTDFLDAYEGARALALPNEPVMARTEATKRQLGERRNPFPLVFAPSRVSGQYLYLPGRMKEDEQAAFAAFLASRGYYAEHA